MSRSTIILNKRFILKTFLLKKLVDRCISLTKPVYLQGALTVVDRCSVLQFFLRFAKSLPKVLFLHWKSKVCTVSAVIAESLTNLYEIHRKMFIL